MSRKYYYDITDFRMALGVTNDDWNVEDIHSLTEFNRWVGDGAEIVESNRKIEEIPSTHEIDIEEVKRIERVAEEYKNWLREFVRELEEN